jgi:hypothetical protein
MLCLETECAWPNVSLFIHPKEEEERVRYNKKKDKEKEEDMRKINHTSDLLFTSN